jgi:uncharacterized protein DUF3152
MTPIRFLAIVVVLASCSINTTTATSTPPASTIDSAASALDAVTTTASSTTTSTTSTTSTTTTTTTTTLPDPATLPRSGTGEFTHAAAGSFEIEGSPMIEFAVAAEDGAGVDVDEVAAFVVATLSDTRGWVGRGAGFRLVEEGGLFTVVVATPDTVDRLCLPLQTNGRFSCARNGWIALNLIRWETATDSWPGDLLSYRRYLINHEVGHYIVGPSHPPCPGAGETAPVMMQQTKGLDGCIANEWVVP